MAQAGKIRVIIGLGNEGGEYQKTYHNVGSFVTSYLKKHSSMPKALRFETHPGGFMNVIGLPVSRLMRMGNYSPAESLIVHDETDLPRGQYKLVFGGGSAGHKGIKSIIEAIGGEDFWRLRIGVRDSNEIIRKKAEEFVLHTWSSADEAAFKEVAQKAWEEMLAKGLI